MSLGAEYGDLYEDYLEDCKESGEEPDDFGEWVNNIQGQAELMLEDAGKYE